MACADCGCVIDRGLREETCAASDCCCSWLESRQSLEQLAEAIARALSSLHLDGFEELLADDVRWGDDEAAENCRGRKDVIETFARLTEAGLRAEVREHEIGPAGVLAHLQLTWPESEEGSRPSELFHLYRVRHGRITEILVPGDRAAGEVLLSHL